MRLKHGLALFGVGVAAALLLLVGRLEPKAPAPIASPARPAAPTPQALPAPLRAGPGAGGLAAARALVAATAPPRPDLARALVLEDDARAFVLKAKASGDPQARRYANHIVGGCQSAIGTLDATRQAQPDIESMPVEQYQAATAALALLQRRCGQFTPDELRDIDSGPDLSTKEGRVVAALLALGRQPHADPMAARNAVLAAAVDSADPLLWAQWGRPLLVRAGPQDSYLYLDGAAISMKAHPDMPAAVSLVPCLLGMDCSSKTSSLALECFGGFGCFDSLFDQVRANVAQGDPARYAAILGAANRIAEAIKAGDAKALTP